ncbi:uncharacterized protein LOC118183454 [Stegodyphus dumicola]|uniref:uncharacterized protein LOC118183454 n=1 Tax=Stegodyphus dumicola TaxID=202533 RepID=UPI0015B20A93|nr:uncharacterized protein LOC118183454 [Stegodyphus dumicola]
MAIYSDLNDYDDVLGETDEIPCEFCERLFPFELIHEHQLACQEESFVGGGDLIKLNPVSTVPFQQSEKKVTSEMQKTSVDSVESPDEKKLQLHKPFSKLSVSQTEKSDRISVIQKNSTSSPKSYVVKQQSDIVEDLTMEESGIKLMEYGSRKQHDNTETERKTFKIPSILTLNNENSKADKTDDSCSSLSEDDDDNECLEEFWKRAEVKNQRRLKMLQNKKNTKFYNQ